MPLKGTPRLLRIWVERAEKPHIGISGVPFMKRTTSLDFTSLSIQVAMSVMSVSENVDLWFLFQYLLRFPVELHVRAENREQSRICIGASSNQPDGNLAACIPFRLFVHFTANAFKVGIPFATEQSGTIDQQGGNEPRDRNANQCKH